MSEPEQTEISKEAMTFVAVFQADERQSQHLARMTARIKDGGCAVMDRTTIEPLLETVRRGLRSGHMVTPVETLLDITPERIELRHLGRVLLKEVADEG